jgi:hypothetical protein
MMLAIEMHDTAVPFATSWLRKIGSMNRTISSDANFNVIAARMTEHVVCDFTCTTGSQ